MIEALGITALLAAGSIFFVGLMALVVMISQKQRQAWLDALHRTAHDHRLAVDEGTWLKGPTASGKLERHSVLVDTYTVSTGKSSSTYTRVRVWENQPEHLTIVPEGLGASFAKALGASDLEVGDPAFDPHVVLRGERPSRILSRLDAPARAAIARATKLNAKLEGGTWTLTEGGMVLDAERLSGLVRVVLDAARALDRTDVSEVDGLRALVERDPEPSVRVRALTQLISVDADPHLVEKLLDDHDPLVRLRAALAVSHAETLLDLVVGPMRQVRREAAVALGRLGVGDARVLDELVAQLRQPDDDVFDALAAVGTVSEVQPLRVVADGHVSIGRVSRGATRAIRAIQSRLDGAEAGSLAVADVGTGALSEAEARDRGRLAQARRERN